MIQVSSKTIIHAPADAIWRLISDFGAACQYLASVVECTVEGEGVGARRTLTQVDGSTIVERLVVLDEAAHAMSYSLLTDTPFRNCLTTITLADIDPERCQVTWSATFEADGLPVSEAAELMEGVLASNCLTLYQFLEH